MSQVHFVADREAYDAAAALMSEFGAQALSEAASRAEQSRGVGNFIHYTRWCRAGRVILQIADPKVAGTLH